MNKRKLQIEQIDNKIDGFAALADVPVPSIGWIKAIRLSLGMTMRQLGDRLSVSKQGVQQIEQREEEGTITINSLRDAANALDMRLVYGFVPNDGTLEALIHRKAHELAVKIVSRTATTMELEDQANSDERIKKAVEERVAALKYEMPRMLWD